MARLAVMIGANGPATTKLRFAQSDATRLADVLSKPRCSYQTVVLDPSVAANCLIREIEHAADNCKRGDTFLIFFAGHGRRERGELLLLLDNSTLEDGLLSTTLKANDVVRAMRYSKASQKLLILDCCDAGTIIEGARWRATPSNVTDYISGITTEEQRTKPDTEAFYTLLASDRLEGAREFDQLRAGFMSFYLSEALDRCFSEADADRDGAIDIHDLEIWFEKKREEFNISNSSAKVPMPIFYGLRRHRVYITRPPEKWIEDHIDALDTSELSILPGIYEHEEIGEIAYVIGRTPITNKLYRTFVDCCAPGRPECHLISPAVLEEPQARIQMDVEGWGWGEALFCPWSEPEFQGDDLPVLCVNFRFAMSYIEWLNARAGRCSHPIRYTLPPPWLWDLAAFGVPHRVYGRVNWPQRVIHHKALRPASVVGSNAEQRVGPFGALDLIGNVWEWCSPPSRAGAPLEMRGGSYADDLDELSPFREFPFGNENNVYRHTQQNDGFRLAASIPIAELPNEVVEMARLHPAAAAARKAAFLWKQT